MKTLYLVFLFFFGLLSYSTKAQILTFSFSGNNGDETTYPSSSNAGGVQPSAIVRGSGSSAAASGDRFNSISWTTSANIALTDYIEYTCTPVNGYAVDITSIQVQHRRSSTGPRKFVIRTSLDGFATNASGEVTIADVITQQNNSFALFAPISTTNPVIFRIYAYAAETATGSWGPGEDTGADISVFGILKILPVKFINVKASPVNGTVKITWANAVESNVKQYIVEHSIDARNFTSIGMIDPLKNNSEEATYGYLHNNPSVSINYYRIKAVELNGMVEYSTVIKISTDISLPRLTIYANPIQQGSLKFALADLAGGDYRIMIYNNGGQVIKKVTVKHDGGSFSSLIALHSISKGIYFLEIDGAMKLHSQFIVQ